MLQYHSGLNDVYNPPPTGHSCFANLLSPGYCARLLRKDQKD